MKRSLFVIIIVLGLIYCAGYNDVLAQQEQNNTINVAKDKVVDKDEKNKNDLINHVQEKSLRRMLRDGQLSIKKSKYYQVIKTDQ